jgi:integrase
MVPEKGKDGIAMANRAVNLTRRDSEGFFHAVEFTNTGKIRNAGPGVFYLDWREGEKRRRQSVGRDTTEALTQLKRKEAALNAVAEGVDVNIPANDNFRSLAGAIRDYLHDVERTKKKKTLAAYRLTLEYFSESCKKTTIESITRDDLLDFRAFLDKKSLTQRTAWNKFSNLMSFLKAQGVRGLAKKGDWPRFTEETPEIYEREDLDSLFAACDKQERLWYEFFLMTGMREQEVMHCSWSDVNLQKGIVTVRWKPEYGFTPKNYKERHVPIPDRLVAALKAHQAKTTKNYGLLFPTSGCKPKGNFLDDLKAVAERTELDKESFWLHKFRATFCTTHLRNGVDLRTVQAWMGHTDIESTMRYLRPAEGDAVREKVNTAFA